MSAVIASGIVPAALEMMDQSCIGAVEDSVYAAGYPRDAAAVLLTELDGRDDAAVQAEAESVEAILAAHGARSVRTAADAGERARLWQGRKKAFGAMGRLSRDLVVQDAVVPRSALPDVLERIGEIAARYGLRVSNVFHAGDGNLHPNISFDSRIPGLTERVEAASGEIMAACIAVGGTITGEHGIGLDKLRYMPHIFDGDSLAAMHAVRLVFDPAERVNPGKVIPMHACREWAGAPGVRNAERGMRNGNQLRTPHSAFRIGTMKIAERVRALLGGDAVLEDTGSPDGVPRIAPASPDAVALLLGTARAEGWRVRVEGAGTWMQADAPADLSLTTRRLDRVPSIQPQDLTATAEAGIGCDQLRQQLADHGVWLALDPPGLAGRTLGSVVATASAGPLRHGFGPVRDHLLGVTFVTGDGRLIQSGGRVMKNVAGYDLTRMQAGGFGAFGVIVLVHLRLRALPRVDQTLILEGSREDLSRMGDDISAAGLTLAALELLSPALARRERWALAVRLAGSAPLVAAEEAGLRAATGGLFTALRADEAHAFWMRAAETFATRPVAFRIGGLPDSSDELLDLVQHQVGDEWVSASPGVGALRWAGDATVDRLRRLRRALAVLEVPLTVERAPWAVRRAVGHFGAYREGVGPLVAGLRSTFDPGNSLAVAIESDG